MHSHFETALLHPARRFRAAMIALILLVQVVALAVAYQFVIEVDCFATGHAEICRLMRSMIARALALAAGLGLLFLARRAVFQRLAQRAQSPGSGARRGVLFNLVGFAVLLAPAVILPEITGPQELRLAIGFWVVGGLLAVPASLRWLAPWHAWREFLAGLGWLSAPVVVLVLVIPELADIVQPLWDISALTLLTFAMVFQLLLLLGADAFARPDDFVIGVDSFAVHIAAQCSGVEGFVLVGSFVAVYAALFHGMIRPMRYWLIVLPLALLLSWLLNILRIALLVLLGAHVSPTLAVDGFHSYAGWLFFTLLALGVILLVHISPFLHRAEHRAGQRQTPQPALRRDDAAARLLPFVAFMLSGIVAAAFFPVPAAGYPLRVLIMLLALAPFWAQYVAFEWRLDPVALGAGALVGLGWVVSHGDPGAHDGEVAAMLAGMSAAGAASWIALRVFGTVVLVPLIEELFFRGYLLARLDRGGLSWRIVAIAVSTAAFALLHGRWLEAGLAGLIFAGVFLRRQRIGDAVLAHAVANAVVAAAAVAIGNWTLI